jgi:hypothetical protein
MAMDLNFTNIFQFFSAISPLLLGFFMIMISVFNQDLKGMVYLAGVLITTVLSVIVLNVVKSEKFLDASPTCSLVNIPFMTQFNSPSLNSVLIAFTFTYLLLPMMANKQMNYAIIGTVIALFIIDGMTKVIHKCTSFGGVVLGMLVGAFCGFSWYTLFHVTGYDSLLYFNETMSNRTYCSRPKKQTFKCAVYKNGQLVKTL